MACVCALATMCFEELELYMVIKSRPSVWNAKVNGPDSSKLVRRPKCAALEAVPCGERQVGQRTCLAIN